MDLQNISLRSPSAGLLSDLEISAFCVAIKLNGYPLDSTDIKVVFSRMAAVEQLTSNIEMHLNEASDQSILRLRCLKFNDSNADFQAINCFDLFMSKHATDNELSDMKIRVIGLLRDSPLFSETDPYGCKHLIECSPRREDFNAKDFHRDHTRYYTRYM